MTTHAVASNEPASALTRALKERDEARARVEALLKGTIVNCVYCGLRLGTAREASPESLRAHAESCGAHPMSALRREVDELRAQVARLRAGKS